MRVWKVGELAEATGITVRTLHHYEQVGLVQPAKRTPAGYRLYGDAELARLQQVLSLRELGLSLEQIRERLDEGGWATADVLELQLAQLEAQIDERVRLRDRLRRMIASLRASEVVGAEEFIQTMRMMTMFEKYYTPEQLEALEERRRNLGDARIREVEAEWPRLIAEVQAEFDRGTDPGDPRMRELSTRWMDLVREFTGGDPGITRSLRTMYENEEQVAGMDVGPMRSLQEYIGRAVAAARASS